MAQIYTLFYLSALFNLDSWIFNVISSSITNNFTTVFSFVGCSSKAAVFFIWISWVNTMWPSGHSRGGSRGAIEAIAPPKTNESNFIHHYFVQFWKQNSRCKAPLSSIFCHSSVVKYTLFFLQWRSRYETWLQILLKSSHPLTILAISDPASERSCPGRVA